MMERLTAVNIALEPTTDTKLYSIEEFLESPHMISIKGGYTRQSLAKVGVPWPPRKGWKQDLIRNYYKAILVEFYK